MVFLIIAGAIAVVALWAVATYNALVKNKNLTQEGWSGIEAQLKRRADLIPNLVETVKGYAAHEKTTLDEVTRLRTESANAPTVEARAAVERQITSAIGKIMAVAEAYPDLKASANFQSLQASLAEVEDQIQMSRRYYNGAVRNLNVMIEQFPSNLIANQFAFQQAQYFEIENAADRAVPQVKF
jgi:LemA protein